MSRILRPVLAVTNTVISEPYIEDDAIIVPVRPYKNQQLRCPICGKRGKHYDRGRRRVRRWRALDMVGAWCYLEYQPSRVLCSEHGVHTEAVPWARPGTRHTRGFEDWVSCLTLYCSSSAVSGLARIAWPSVGGIARRVFQELESTRGSNRFDGLKRIGIDETSYKKGHKYLTVVVDHDRGCLVWAGEGHGTEVLKRFFDGLTSKQRRDIEVVTADGASWIKSVVKKRCRRARLVMDPFHVVSWVNDALDKVRRQEWQIAKQEARKAMPTRSRPGRPSRGEETPAEANQLKERAKAIHSSRFALTKNPENLTERQKQTLNELKVAGSHLFKVWELKEDLRAIFQLSDLDLAVKWLNDWLHRASRCGIEAIVAVQKKIRRRYDDILAAIELGISNGRVEAINSKIKLSIRMAYGFRNTKNLISLVMLRCSDLKPSLPFKRYRRMPAEAV